MTRIGLVACGKGKLDRPAPARELYNGALFRKASAYCEATYDRWLILSAKHGLIDPETVVEPYDLSLSHLDHAGRRAWAERVVAELRRRNLLDAEFYLHAGEKYARPLEPLLGATNRPLRGLGIGRQLAWYRSRGY
jgi:hypothetical protein